MGNACNCVRNQTQEDDDDALLRGLMEENERLRGPPPPYQVGVKRAHVKITLASFVTAQASVRVQCILAIKSSITHCAYKIKQLC